MPRNTEHSCEIIADYSGFSGGDSQRLQSKTQHEISISTSKWNKTLFSAYIIQDRDHEKAFHLKTFPIEISFGVTQRLRMPLSLNLVKINLININDCIYQNPNIKKISEWYKS